MDTTTFSEVGSLPVTPSWTGQGLNMNWRVKKNVPAFVFPELRSCPDSKSHQWRQLMGGPGVAGSMLFYLKVWKVSLDFEREHMKNTYMAICLDMIHIALFGEDLWELMDMFPIQALYTYCTIWLFFVYYMQV